MQTEHATIESDRTHLVSALEASQHAYDKAILTLSGGALGMSLAFLEHVAGSPPFLSPDFLIYAWSAWAVSVLATLVSFYFSVRALRIAITQHDSDDDSKQGGRWATATEFCNVLAGLAFVAGLAMFFAFAQDNIGASNERSRQEVPRAQEVGSEEVRVHTATEEAQAEPGDN